MASSRIFVRNLPPTFSENEFKAHFSKFSAPTDTRFFGSRRIGYVGYRTPEDAAKAVKYFNKSFIRMSRIGVELARPANDTSIPKARKRNDDASHSIQPSSHKEQDTNATPETSRKRKRNSAAQQDADPKLKEYLNAMQPPAKSKSWRDVAVEDHETASPSIPRPSKTGHDFGDKSDEDYQSIVKPNKRQREDGSGPVDDGTKHTRDVDASEASDQQLERNTDEAQLPQSDAEWLRSRTSRLLGLLDEDEEDRYMSKPNDEDVSKSPIQQAMDDDSRQASEVVSHEARSPEHQQDDATPVNADEQAIRKSKRLFLRNLPYSVTEDDLSEQFERFGGLEEVHVPMDNKTGLAKGFAYILFADADSALRVYHEMDASIFQGRLLHILPADPKRESKLDEFAISKLPLKKQKRIQRKSEATSSTFNWNSLYMNQDAVVASIAERLGINKSDVLDPTSSDAAVKQAFAETHVIQETKRYFAEQGVDLEAFKSGRRGDTTILIKNFPFGTKADELEKMFEEYGKVLRFLMPSSGTIAIAEFAVAPEARAAFKALAYRKIKDSILFLEWAPKDLFRAQATPRPSLPTDTNVVAPKPTAAGLLQNDAAHEIMDTSTLFVRNLSFATTSQRLEEAFAPLEGFHSAKVKTKPDPKKPGQTLSMGFGFLEFRSKEHAKAALAAMDGYVLDGYTLDIKPSQKALDAAEERRRADKAKTLAGRGTKIIIKNLPFEASKNEVRALFGAYGQLRSIRVPKKFDRSARGFAFAEFTTPREAESAMDALRNTHLLGRKLVLEYAADEPDDPEAEIEKMQHKVGAQADRVAVQKLLGTSRKKFNVSGEEQEED